MVRALYNTLLLSLLWRTATAGATTSSHTALPHGYYEELHNSTASQRLGNVDLLELDDADIAMCHLVNYLGFSRASATDCSDQNQAAKIYKELAATLLAIQHFNNGNGVIVKEIEGIQDRCPIRLSAEFHDSQYTPTVVVQSLTQVLTTNKPCAVVGARTSSSTSPSAIVSGVYDVPQMSFTATSPELNDRFKYPYFSRLVPADDAAAKAAVRFLSHTVQSTHLAVLYVNDPFGNNYNQAIQRQADRFNITLQSFPLAFPPNEDDIKVQVARLKETGIRHVYMVFFSSHIGPVMTQAAQLDIVGPEYFWFLGISTSYFGNAQLEPDSPLIPALTGMGVLPEFGAKPDTSGYHRFVDVWKQLDETDVNYFNRKMPPIRGHELCFQAEPTFFQDVDSGSTAHFAYDTVMALGLGACAAAAANKEDNNGAFAGFDGTQHTQAIIDTVFEGATGIVSLEQETGSRDPLRFQYAVLNVQPKVDPETNLVTFETPETVILTPNEALTDWEMIPKQPFYYADGSTTPPASLPDVAVEMNYLGDLVTFGYVTCAIIVGCSLAFAAWTFLHRQVRVVRASQPFFLVMVCSGVLVMGLVLIPLSVDDEHFGKEGTDAACMSIPWLSSMGFVMAFSALASKTWRINKLHQNAMRFTRLKLTPWDVLKPFLILTTANVIVLLAWTIVAPLQFVRMPDSGTDQWNRVVSSTGRCVHNQHDSGDSIPFMIALAVVNLSAVVFANAQAYMARNIHTEYSESRYIALIMCLLLQSWLTGIPVIGLVYDIPRASYVVVVLIVLLTSMAILLLIFVPKIMYTRAFLNGEITGAKNRLSTKLNDEDGNPDEWEDDDNKSDDNDGLKVKVFRDSACVNVGSDSLRQSYASVEGLKLYLRQSNSKRIDNSLTGSISNSHAEMSGSLRHSAKNLPPMENLSSGSMQQSSEKSLKHAAPPMARLSEESTKDLESSRSMHTRSEELPPEPHDIEEALSRIAHTMRRNSRP